MDPQFTIDEIIDLEREAGQMFGPFHRQWYLDRAPEKVRRHLENARKFPDIYGMPSQGFYGVNGGPGTVFTGAGTASTSSNAEYNSLQQALTQAVVNQYCAIPANDAYPGKVYEFKTGGIYSTSATAPTFIATPRWGSSTTPTTNVTLGASGTWTTIASASNLPYYAQFTFTIRTAPAGATLGTGEGAGTITLQIPVTSSQLAATLVMGATVATIDLSGQGTAGCGLNLNFTWGTAATSNVSTAHWWVLSSIG